MPQKPTGRSRTPKLNKPKLRMPDVAQGAPGPPVCLDDKVNVTVNEQEYVVKAEELIKIKELGRGAYGVVETMKHEPSGAVFAVKRIPVTFVEQERKRMRNEVIASKQSGRCPFMVRFYGAMFREGDVWLCMEVMDTSLDKLLNMASDMERSIPEEILGKIAYSILQGLSFMKEELNLMHRDMKPSNVLLSRTGQIKICDFGISGHLTNSIAKTMNAGCKPYMAPELIDPPRLEEGQPPPGYDVRADVWSIGITMIELATGKHPYEKWKTPFEQLKQVVEKDPPTLPSDGQFSSMFHEFVNLCLRKHYSSRPKFLPLLSHPFIETYGVIQDDVVARFACDILDTYEARQKAIADSLASSLEHQHLLSPPSTASSSMTLLRLDSPGDGSATPDSLLGHSRSGSNVSSEECTSDLLLSSPGQPSGSGDAFVTPSSRGAVTRDLCAFGGDGSTSVSGCSSADSTGLAGKAPFS